MKDYGFKNYELQYKRLNEARYRVPRGSFVYPSGPNYPIREDDLSMMLLHFRAAVDKHPEFKWRIVSRHDAIAFCTYTPPILVLEGVKK